MYVIELLLPLYDNSNRPFSREMHDRVRREMPQQFGGVTAFSRSPAEGLWKQSDNTVSRDDVVVFEVMVERLDRTWWAAYKTELEQRFQQEKLVVRASNIELL